MSARTLVSSLVAIGLLLAAGYAVNRLIKDGPAFPLTSRCEVTGDTTVRLEAEQMANAATIAAVGLRRDLPLRAVTVALATGLQESKLRNLTGGDRDSVGLFQQRPSQGWGEPEQLNDPRYAAGAFYDHLVRIHGWQKMRITDAAQAVQKSAHPEAYQKWADEARVLTRALAGEAPGSVACRLDEVTDRTTAPGALAEAIALDWGDAAADAVTADGGVSFTVPDGRSGWRLAHWLVAHAEQHGITDIRYAGHRWTAEDGGWQRTKSAGRDTVSVRYPKPPRG